MEVFAGIHAGAPVDAEGERLREVRRELERRWEQLRWHTAQARRHKAVSAAIVQRHEQEARRLAEELGIYGDGPEAANTIRCEIRKNEISEKGDS
jgi:hypothetical protein